MTELAAQHRKAQAEADEKLISEIEAASASDRDKSTAILLLIQGRSHKEIQSVVKPNEQK